MPWIAQPIEERLMEAYERYLTHSPSYAKPRTLYIGKLDYADLRVYYESLPHLVNSSRLITDPPPPPTWRGIPIFVADCNRGFKFSPT